MRNIIIALIIVVVLFLLFRVYKKKCACGIKSSLEGKLGKLTIPGVLIEDNDKYYTSDYNGNVGRDNPSDYLCWKEITVDEYKKKLTTAERYTRLNPYKIGWMGGTRQPDNWKPSYLFFEDSKYYIKYGDDTIAEITKGKFYNLIITNSGPNRP